MTTFKHTAAALLAASLLTSTAYATSIPAGSTLEDGIQLQPGTVTTTTTTTSTMQAPVEEAVRNSTTTTTTIIQPPATETVVVNETTIYGQQISADLIDQPKAKRFYNLLVTSGLGAQVDEVRGYTAFVPYDSAFAGTSVGSNHTPGVVDADARALLEKHIADGKFNAERIHGQRETVTTRSGEKIVVSKGQRGTFYANNVRIVDILKTHQGIIYFTDRAIVK